MKQRSILFLAICTLTVGLMTSTAHAAEDMFLVFPDATTGQTESLQTQALNVISFSFGVANSVALTSSQLVSCTDCATTSAPVVFLSSFTAASGKGDTVQVLNACHCLETFVFGQNAFSTPGTYTDKAGNATLTVSVPEPSAAGFTMAGGILLAGLTFFRRKSVTGNLLA